MNWFSRQCLPKTPGLGQTTYRTAWRRCSPDLLPGYREGPNSNGCSAGCAESSGTTTVTSILSKPKCIRDEGLAERVRARELEVLRDFDGVSEDKAVSFVT